MNFIISHVMPRRGMATNGSDSHRETKLKLLMINGR